MILISFYYSRSDVVVTMYSNPLGDPSQSSYVQRRYRWWQKVLLEMTFSCHVVRSSPLYSKGMLVYRRGAAVACRKTFDWGKCSNRNLPQATKCPRITNKRWSITDKRWSITDKRWSITCRRWSLNKLLPTNYRIADGFRKIEGVTPPHPLLLNEPEEEVTRLLMICSRVLCQWRFLQCCRC